MRPSILIALVCSFGSAAAGESVGEIVSALGEVEILREGHWQPLKPGDQVAAGAVVRTGAGSRAAVQLANGTQLKLNAHSQLELKSLTARAHGYVRTSADAVKNVLRVLSGEVWIRNSGEPLEIQTLPATATIRGTEFNLAVEPDNITSLAVLEGLVELSNPQGSVLVATNERGVAKLGKAPRKTVLVNPRDAVQWTLYYPGQVSYRDYPLTSLAPSQLKDRADTLNGQLANSPRDLNALVELGEVSFDLGKRKEARAAFERALRLAPTIGAAHTGLGWVYLDGGEPKAALGEFRLAKPATARTLAGKALALYQLGRLDEAQQVTAEAKQRFPSSPLPYTQAALDALVRGEPDVARQALDRALVHNPNDAVARSLQSNIDLVQNRKQLALDKAEQAIRANPSSPTAYLALSAAEQAEFDLNAALKAARKAVELDPDNPQTRIQEARLLFGMGRTREAYAVAQEARSLPPKDSMVESTWGFILLARNQIDEAIAAFKEATALDSTRGEPHLGLGLALFRQNNTEAAVAELRKASLLGSQVSLYQSYLGKAYYEVKNDPLAKKSFNRAKKLDPRDPTPYFYDAIRLQSINRPVEALENLQESIALNDNRAVYRSRLLLDEDLAARSANLARIYDNLGFDRLAQLEATKSLTFDPSNFSAHRFLADSYANRPRHEIARVSELLQAQLLQPANINPVQPSLAETGLNIASGGSFGGASFGEYTSLYERDRTQVLASVVGGNHSTLGDELLLSGIEGRWSYSLGQFHYKTNGFRENNDQKHDIYSAFGQLAVAPGLGLQAEVRRRETEQGDLALRFFPISEYVPSSGEVRVSTYKVLDRFVLRQDSARLGARLSVSPQSDVIATISYVDREEERWRRGQPRDTADDEGYQGEARYLLRRANYNLTTGLGVAKIKSTSFYDGEKESEGETRQSYGYFYGDVLFSRDIVATIGVSRDRYQKGNLDLRAWNPKFGLRWSATDRLRLRLAAYKTLKRRLAAEQTIEPTAVGGFNQFFDDINGTRARNYAIGLDSQITKTLHAGVEGLRRELKVPQADESDQDVDETIHSAFLYWAPLANWGVRAEYRLEKYESPASSPFLVETRSVPFAIRYFSPSGLFAEVGTTYVWQKVEDADVTSFEGVNQQDREDFLLLDVALGYRFPKRRGFAGVWVKNLLDEEFRYQDTSFNTSHEELPLNAAYAPSRTIFAGVALNF